MPKRNRSARPSGDVLKAFQDVVYDFGVEAMAEKIGMPKGSLYNKANQNDSSLAKPTLSEGVLVQVVSGDTRIVEAMAHVLGGVFCKLPTLDHVSDVALIEMLCEIHVQDGLFHDELKKALVDKKFTQEEYVAIQLRAMRYITTILETVNRIQGMVDD